MTISDKYILTFEAFFNGDFDDHEKETFEKALRNDKEMQIAWMEYKAIMSAFSDQEAITLRIQLNDEFKKQKGRQKVMLLAESTWFRLSAAAVVLIIMSGLLYFFCSNEGGIQHFNRTRVVDLVDTTNRNQQEGNKTNMSYNKDTIPKLDIEENVNITQIASLYEREEYQISPIYAELLHNVYRSAWFRLDTPADSILFSSGDSLIFSWETNITESFYFDILDRNGLVIYKHPEAIMSPWSFSPQLSPAIYMFRFATESEPIWMGVMVGR